MKNINRKVIVYGTPKSKERPRLGRGGRVFTPSTTLKEEERVYREWVRQDGEPAEEEDAIMIELYAYFKKPKKSKFKNGIFPIHLKDIDNILKLLLDALQGEGKCFKNDSQVIRVFAQKYWCTDDEEERIEFIVRSCSNL